MGLLTCVAITQFCFPVSPLLPCTVFLPFPVFYMGLLSHWFVFLSLSRERGRTIPGHARWSGMPASGPEAQPSVPDHLLPGSLGDLDGQSSPASLRDFTAQQKSSKFNSSLQPDFVGVQQGWENPAHCPFL